uniref:NADH-ubiquinone oxidoreductase chain 4 n=1 Tax=Robertsicus elaphensis TaxID=2599317 RepID=H9M756_9ACAR|nr:NADH dehydrogenase subunit 4 [Robertsicus elaphensis]AET63073.1 NADH dehydrogenase subunit 4 [Robertsicus elaphensis]
MLKFIMISFLILCSFFLLNNFQIIIMLLFLFIMSMMFILGSSEINSFFFYLDLMSNMMISLTIWISILMMISSIKNNFMNKSFIFYILLMMFMLINCFSIMNLLYFYFFFECTLFPMIMMIFGWGNQPERFQAAIYLFIYTLLGSIPLLMMMMIYGKISLSYMYMEWFFLKLGYKFILMLIGFLVKIPMFLFHLWLPKAHVEAPISGSMMLAAILLKLGIYGIFRFKSFLIVDLLLFNWLLMIVSICGSMIVSILCMFQVDLKSLIAYSSVCHMGIVLTGTLTMFNYSCYGILLLMIGHGLCSSGLFCLANLLYERFYTRSMILVKGSMKFFPSLTLMWFILSAVNMSAPLSMNLMGEILIMMSILKYSMFFAFPIMLIIFMSACYSIYMYSYVNHGLGWIVWSMNFIRVREYYLIFLHIMPIFMWILKMNFFIEWL